MSASIRRRADQARERDGQVDGDGGFTHTAFAGTDSDDFETPGSATGAGIFGRVPFCLLLLLETLLFYSIERLDGQIRASGIPAKGPTKILQEAGIKLLSRFEQRVDFNANHLRKNRVDLAHSFGQSCGSRLQNEARSNLVDVILFDRTDRRPTGRERISCFFTFMPHQDARTTSGCAL